MPAYDYALVRAVDVPTGDAVTLGAVLSCRQARFLGVRLSDSDAAADRLGLDADLLRRALVAFRRTAEGGPEAGPVGRLPPSERFHFLTAARSTSLGTGPVRTGVADDPPAELERIARGLGIGAPAPSGLRSAGGTRPGASGV